MQQLKIKLLDLCKIRTKKSSREMFNFYIVLADHDLAGLPHAGENSKSHHYKKKYKKGPSKNMGFNGKTVWRFQTKKNKSRHVQLLCSLCWSWHGHWRGQSHHVQVQIQNPITINKKYKKWRTFRKWVSQKNRFNVSDDKKVIHF